eukprot:RCo003091
MMNGKVVQEQDQLEDCGGDEGETAPLLEALASFPSYPRPENLPMLTWIPLAALIFFEVSGGPFGSESTVRDAGPLVAILGFVLFPFVWCIQEALITAELCTMFPENSGFVAWVSAAFGPFWGFQEGLFSWCSGMMDNAIYPGLFIAYVHQAI